MHNEMRRGVSDLLSVTEEIRTGLDPLTLGRRILTEVRGESARVFRGNVPRQSEQLREHLPARLSVSSLSDRQGMLVACPNQRTSTSLNYIPISAVSLGHRSRNLIVISGVDLLDEAVVEAEVAYRVSMSHPVGYHKGKVVSLTAASWDTE